MGILDTMRTQYTVHSTQYTVHSTQYTSTTTTWTSAGALETGDATDSTNRDQGWDEHTTHRRRRRTTSTTWTWTTRKVEKRKDGDDDWMTSRGRHNRIRGYAVRAHVEHVVDTHPHTPRARVTRREVADEHPSARSSTTDAARAPASHRGAIGAPS